MNIESIFPGLRDNKTSKTTTSRGIISKALSGNNEAAKTLETGQKITGEVLSNDGSKLTLKLPGNMVLNARMDQSVAAGVGERVTFLVKSNDGGTVQLQPLMENLAGQGTAMKALQAAGLVANDKTISMTLSMMEEGMSIGKNTLMAMYSKVLSNPQASIQNLVQMTKMDIPIDANNVEQFEKYKNFENVIRDSFNDVLELLPDSVNDVFASQGNEAGLKFLANVMELAIGDSSIADYENIFSNEDMDNITQAYDTGNILNENGSNIDVTIEDKLLNKDADINIISTEDNSLGVKSQTSEMASAIASKISESLNSIFGNKDSDSAISIVSPEIINNEEADQINKLLSSDDLNSDDTSSLQTNPEKELILPAGTKELIYSFIESGDNETALSLLNNTIQDSDLLNAFGKLLLNEFSKLTNGESSKAINDGNVEEKIPDAAGEKSLPNRIFSNERFQNIFKDAFLKQTMLKPEELTKENVAKLFEKMLQNSKELINSLDNAVPKDAAIKNSVENIRDNLQFMDSINQTYSFVQIPLKMNSAKGEGELYVYSNKKGLAGKDGSPSAYLHLDMENLGLVNCYVKMNPGQKVITNFYLEDESSLDLIEKHLPELTKRLADRGYTMSSSCQMNEPKRDLMDIIMEKEQGSVSLSHLTFDVRA